jgi:MurNAc alpha-1-phosphate uridylyltransferase
MTLKISQAFIFAAGRGERMRPITDTIPKPLVKIKNKAILDYAIEKLNNNLAIKKIIINGFYLAQQVEDHIKNLHNPKIIFSHEVEKVETGGGLLFAKDKIDFTQPLLLINGDTLWQEKSGIDDITLLCEAYAQNPCNIMLGLKKKEEFIGYEGNIHGGGDFNFNPQSGALQRFSQVAMDYVFVGPQIINPQILNNVSEKCFSMSHFYKAAMRANGDVNGIYGCELKGRYFHVGQWRQLQKQRNIFDTISKIKHSTATIACSFVF